MALGSYGINPALVMRQRQALGASAQPRSAAPLQSAPRKGGGMPVGTSSTTVGPEMTQMGPGPLGGLAQLGGLAGAAKQAGLIGGGAANGLASQPQPLLGTAVDGGSIAGAGRAALTPAEQAASMSMRTPSMVINSPNAAATGTYVPGVSAPIMSPNAIASGAGAAGGAGTTAMAGEAGAGAGLGAYGGTAGAGQLGSMGAGLGTGAMGTTLAEGGMAAGAGAAGAAGAGAGAGAAAAGAGAAEGGMAAAGAANAWNPIGWGLLGAGALFGAGSAFDWW